MKTLIVYDHPYRGSYCHAILEAVKNGLATSGQEIDVIDLHEDKFDPVMTGTDLLAFTNHQIVDEKAYGYAERLRQADHLVMIFPVWWELMPAMTKGFIDKVIFPGTVYKYTKSGMGMVPLLTGLKSTTVITTMNTPKAMYRIVYGNAIKKSLVQGTFKKCGFKNVEWINYGMVKHSSDKKRKKWLLALESRFKQAGQEKP